EVLPARSQILKTEHHAALPYAEIPIFMRELRQRQGSPARALEFTILTAARTNETLGATWEEIDLANAVWSIPPTRMKAGREHRVPLSQACVALLEGLPREDGNEYVFIGGNSAGLNPKSMTQVLRGMGRSETVHGFRSAFMDWSHDQTSFPKTV